MSEAPEVIGKNTRIGDNVKSVVAQLVMTEREKGGLQTDIQEIYAAAKEAGFNTKALRRAVKRSLMSPTKRADEDEIAEIADQYFHAAEGPLD